MAKRKTSRNKKDESILRVLYSIIAIVSSIIALLHTYTGFLGKWLYVLAYYLFGIYWFVMYAAIIIFALMTAFDKKSKPKYWLVGGLIFLAVLLISNTVTVNRELKPIALLGEYFENFKAVGSGTVSYSNAGCIGLTLSCLIAAVANYAGVIIVALTLIIVAIIQLWPEINALVNSLGIGKAGKAKNSKKQADKNTRQEKQSVFQTITKEPETKGKKTESKKAQKDDQKVEKVILDTPEKTSAASKDASGQTEAPKKAVKEQFSDYTQQYNLPRLQFLDAVSPSKKNVNAQAASQKWEILNNLLEQFDLPSSLSRYNIGPSVTQFEVVPEGNFNIRKYLTVKENIKMSLAVKDVRIQCPIPGKSAVGIEIPNAQPTLVRLRELLADVPDKYQHEPLMIALGKDIAGENVYGLINKMPHLLIAGATGSGKSVCINSIILTLLLRTRPDECKLLLVDPKKVEFTPYENVPHLICPVVNDSDKAAVALKKLLTIMEDRYNIFSQNGVRNIDEYNKQNPDKKMYNIVCIIDELADLMATHGKDVEAIIGRLASMARACGIYMILATQRPSTDVITGTIKANIVSRIAFAVNSSYDSRTILDSTGAEDLLGNGDMLYNPAGASAPLRVQGVYVSDEEIKNVINYFIKSNYQPHYADIFIVDEDGEESGLMNNNGKQISDPIYGEVEQWVITQKTISATGLQRRFGLGFPRAAKIIDMLEENGIVSASKGSKPRDVLVHLESEEQ